MHVRREVLGAIEAHARRDHPNECCGLLVGTATTIVEAVACPNSAENPRVRYQIAPEDFFSQIRRCRAAGDTLRVIGAYHSHPHQVPDPSPTDVAEAFVDFLFLIAGPADASAPIAIRAYELLDGNLQPVTLVPDPEETDP